MEQLLLIFYVLVCAAMIGLILLQQGKGADMGASFGSGSSQTMFGPAGGGNVLSRGTGILATVFFAISIALAVVAKHKAEDARIGDIPLPAAEQVAPAQDVPELPVMSEPASDMPVIEAEPVPAADDMPLMEDSGDGTGDTPVSGGSEQ